MATAVTSQKIKANMLIRLWDHDPDTTAATVVTPDAGTTVRWESLGTHYGFGFAAMCTVVSSGAITLMEILGATDSSGTNATVVLSGGTISANAQGDWAMIEVTAEQVNEVGKAAGYNFTHVAGRLTLSNSGTEAAVMYLFWPTRFPQLNLTVAATGA